MGDIEELERMHAAAMGLRDVLFRNRGLEVRETKESYECLNALPGLLAELRAAREALTKISAIRDSIVGLQGFNFSEHAYPLVAALKAAGYEGVGYAIASANLGTLLQRIATLEAERDALREVADAARPFVPVCDEDVLSDENGHGLACGKTATHHSRMGGNNIGYLCDEHTELAHAAAVRAASKGWSKAIDLEAPSTFDADPTVRALAAALAKVPK